MIAPRWRPSGTSCRAILLLRAVAVETLGTRLVLPFGFIDLNEVRGFRIEAADSLLAVPAIVGVAVVGPAGGSSTGSGHDTSSSPAS